MPEPATAAAAATATDADPATDAGTTVPSLARGRAAEAPPTVATRTFASGVVVTPHHLASAAGQAVLANGGNAVDAAVAANLVLAVVTPYFCGTGGDLLAIVHDGRPQGVLSTGAAPSGATPDAIRAAIDAGHGDSSVSFPGTHGMPMFGALPVTVPGAVAGWFHLLERHGTRSFGDVATAAIRLARDGFPVSAAAADSVERARRRLGSQPHWEETYGRMRRGERFVQTDLATTLTTLADDGPAALYGGHLGDRIVETLQAHGSTMTLEDLAAHEVRTVEPLRTSFRDVEVLELPPPTQGVTALQALAVLDHLGTPPDDPVLAVHQQVEAIRAALADRDEHVGDPTTMRTTPEQLLASDRIAALAGAIGDEAATWPPGRPAAGGTAYLCAADGDGMLISLIQSNFVGFGSGVVVPGTGIGLHDRGAHFSLDPDDANAIGPRRVPLHTLIPGMVVREDGAPWLVFGTMGGDGQAQIHVQLLAHLLDGGLDLQDAVTAPRWIVDPEDGAVQVEARAAGELVDGLRARGHRLTELAAWDSGAGHAHAIEVLPGGAGYAAASDPRTEGGAHGL